MSMTRRSLALLLASAVCFAVGCASNPDLSPQGRTSLESLGDSVERVQLQYDRTWMTLEDVRDDWDTDPDDSITHYAREISALESRVGELGAMSDDRVFAEWDAQLRSIRAAELATAPVDDHNDINRAFDRADDRLNEVRDVFSPVYSRYIDFKETFRARSSGETVEDNLTEIRRAVTDSKEASKRLDRFAETLEDMAD